MWPGRIRFAISIVRSSSTTCGERTNLTRGDLSRNGTKRSTVSLIVDELKTQGLIYEIEGESTGGRPPSLLRLRAGGFMAIGADVGTAQTTVAVADLVGRVVEREVFDTNPDVTATYRRLLSVIQRFIKTHANIEGIGVASLDSSIRKQARRFSFHTSNGATGRSRLSYMKLSAARDGGQRCERRCTR